MATNLSRVGPPPQLQSLHMGSSGKRSLHKTLPGALLAQAQHGAGAQPAALPDPVQHQHHPRTMRTSTASSTLDDDAIYEEDGSEEEEALQPRDSAREEQDVAAAPHADAGAGTSKAPPHLLRATARGLPQAEAAAAAANRAAELEARCAAQHRALVAARAAAAAASKAARSDRARLGAAAKQCASMAARIEALEADAGLASRRLARQHAELTKTRSRGKMLLKVVSALGENGSGGSGGTGGTVGSSGSAAGSASGSLGFGATDAHRPGTADTARGCGSGGTGGTDGGGTTGGGGGGGIAGTAVTPEEEVEDPTTRRSLRHALILMSKENQRLVAHARVVEAQAAAARRRAREGLGRERGLAAALEHARAMLPPEAALAVPTAANAAAAVLSTTEPRHGQLLRMASGAAPGAAAAGGGSTGGGGAAAAAAAARAAAAAAAGEAAGAAGGGLGARMSHLVRASMADGGAAVGTASLAAPAAIAERMSQLSDLLLSMSAAQTAADLVAQVLSRRALRLFECQHAALIWRVPLLGPGAAAAAAAAAAATAASAGAGGGSLSSSLSALPLPRWAQEQQLYVQRAGVAGWSLVPGGRGIAEAALAKGQPIAVAHAQAHPAFDAGIDASATPTPQAMLYVPCAAAAGARCVGVLQLATKLHAAPPLALGAGAGAAAGLNGDEERAIAAAAARVAHARFTDIDTVLGSILMAQFASCLANLQAQYASVTRGATAARTLHSSSRLAAAALGDGGALTAVTSDAAADAAPRIAGAVEELGREALRARVRLFVDDDALASSSGSGGSGGGVWCLAAGGQIGPDLRTRRWARRAVTRGSGLAGRAFACGAAEHYAAPEDAPGFNAEVDLSVGGGALAVAPLTDHWGRVFAVLQVAEGLPPAHPLCWQAPLPGQKPSELDAGTAFAAHIAPGLHHLLCRAHADKCAPAAPAAGGAEHGDAAALQRARAERDAASGAVERLKREMTELRAALAAARAGGGGGTASAANSVRLEH